jgi:hypothetical protein
MPYIKQNADLGLGLEERERVTEEEDEVEG